MKPEDHLFVITGGPGSGKSTLIAALAAAGHDVMPEAGRAIIREQVAIGGSALPWADRAAFAALMLERELESWRAASALAGPVFLDRGIPDVIGYLDLCGLPVSDEARHAAGAHRYHRRVFIAPHWPAIFAQDAERKQSAEEAEATCRMMARTYAGLGYETVPLPLAPVAERLAFLRAAIAQPG
jgi:predicted ATPase